MVNSNAKKYEKAEVLLDGDHSSYKSANLGGKGSSADLPSFRQLTEASPATEGP